ncbi:MAG TPA: hypothetical protein VN408_19635 [Actinoplanes sp.]|nr:hypothetical protein [Actinoplanes sp.]
MEGRIWFPGNPWADGHRVEDFTWTGRLDDAGRLWFDITLQTAFYDETFRYEFRAEIHDARLTHVTPSPGTAAGDAQRQVTQLLAVPEVFAESLLTER